MNDELKKYLIEFRECTLKMIEYIEKDDLDSLQRLIDERGNIIKKIDNIEFDKSDFNSICMELDLISINDKLTELTAAKRDEVKSEIIELKRSNEASNAYNHGFGRSAIFSKKV